jgi:hypothetical protein
MDPLTLIIVRAVASTFIKFYQTSLLAGGSAISYNKSELGYKVPKWYMNPGRTTSVMYSYGTSTEGDEFQSIDNAREAAVNQMIKHIRLANQRIAKEKISYSKDSIKQKRLVELFVRGDGLEKFVNLNAVTDKKQLVKTPQDEIRAFVRLKIKADLFIEYQEDRVKELKSKIVHQKTDDILAEMDAEIKTYGDQPFDNKIEEPQQKQEPAAPTPEEVRPPERFLPPPLRKSSNGFEDMENELDQHK